MRLSHVRERHYSSPDYVYLKPPHLRKTSSVKYTMMFFVHVNSIRTP